MHRIDTNGHVTVDGKSLFSNGDPHGATKREGTELGEAWLNDVQENLCRFIEAMGLSLAKGSHTLLCEAIEAAVLAKTEPQKQAINALIRYLQEGGSLPAEL